MPNVGDWVQKKNPATGDWYTVAEAEELVRKEVFGDNYQKDAAGNPIEQGKGSDKQPTQQHRDALARTIRQQEAQQPGRVVERIIEREVAPPPKAAKSNGWTPARRAAASEAARKRNEKRAAAKAGA